MQFHSGEGVDELFWSNEAQHHGFRLIVKRRRNEVGQSWTRKLRKRRKKKKSSNLFIQSAHSMSWRILAFLVSWAVAIASIHASGWTLTADHFSAESSGVREEEEVETTFSFSVVIFLVTDAVFHENMQWTFSQNGIIWISKEWISESFIQKSQKDQSHTFNQWRTGNFFSFDLYPFEDCTGYLESAEITCMQWGWRKSEILRLKLRAIISHFCWTDKSMKIIRK